VVPLRAAHGLLAVAMEDPSDSEALAAVEFVSSNRVLPLMATARGIREAIATQGHAIVTLDLLAQRDAGWVGQALSAPRGSRSLSTWLKSRLGLEGLRLEVVRTRARRTRTLEEPSARDRPDALPVLGTVRLQAA
jgi:hypothetical protein